MKKPRAASDSARSRRPAPLPRDQDASPFAPILEDLIRRVRGAFAAALVDGEGETVDYFGAADPFDVKVAAAHWRVVIAEIAGCTALGRPRSLVVRGTQRSFLAHVLPDGYALILLLRRRAFVASWRALSACERTLGREAGWDEPPSKSAWFPVEVECDARRRPKTVRWGVRGHWNAPLHRLEVLGTLAGVGAAGTARARSTRVPARERTKRIGEAPRRESHGKSASERGGRGVERGERGDRDLGFRVRLESGAEVTLVREPGNFWYADDEVLSERQDP